MPTTLADLEKVGPQPIRRGRYPQNLDSLVHGWRWYRVIDGRLVSPIVNRVELPRDGVLNDAYFIPRAQNIFGLAMQMTVERWYDFALTFGWVSGPFLYDHTMPLVGSMKARQYKAIGIFTTSPASNQLAQAYDFPVIHDLRRSTLAALEDAASKIVNAHG
ncbi:hypothetical protein [Mycobacterium avium]|uniref:hypothetical protein n=1 Tax=Mycobacterium avium TaxID=1764 RepID=UPI001CDC65A9|nr:hypothetical protein [Mycobacterium avium]MCA4732162.1 hypothetical protein [Mycobacterium avium subsp. hominissuis]MDO2360994.1 hypothetical protein [Mycobacterium avium subsp. hominissuis]UBV03754.1 hypothetical protein H8Z54_15010 [Mycobacterium avium subsp. hominissuis]